MTKSRILGLFVKKPLFTTVALFFAILLPVHAVHAGFLSFVKDIFSHRTEVTFERIEQNSQTAIVLDAAVNADPNPSKGGGDITVVGNSALLSESGPSGTIADIEEEANAPKSDQISVYVVREGDSLSQIADMFGVSVNTIRWANDIGSNGVIQPGQTLVILPVSGVRYTVEDGDTLASIAEEFEGDVTEIRNFNGLSADATLAVGDEIVIPHGEISQPSSNARYAQSYTAPTPVQSTQGYYARPVQGGVRTQGLHGYNGIDIAGAPGTPVLASADGKVIISRYRPGNPWFGGYGNYIVIEHDNGTQTLYGHLSDNIVQRGWSVVQGQVIGYMGSTGRSTGTHLHFEVRGARNPF